MKWKAAVTRAIRTTIQAAGAAVLAFYLTVQSDGTFVNIKVHGAVLAFGLFLALVAGVLSLLQNLAEDNSDADVPK